MTFQDARKLASGSIEADVAIVGAGAAGIALALELKNRPLRVALIESGDFAHRHRTQFLYRGKNVGRPNVSTAFSRFRRFGGSTTRWGGQCRPLDALDFEARPGIPGSGWPFDSKHLEPYYRRAQAVCNLGRYDYRPGSWRDEFGGALPMDGDLLATRVYRFAWPRDFGTAYREALARADNVDVYLNANLTEILTRDGAGSVTGLRLATLNRRFFEVAAKYYVLACGGLENPRLLLASTAGRRHGLGNGHGLVGRYFMDHPYIFPGCFEPAEPRFDRSFYVIEGYEQTGSRQTMHAAFTLSDRVQRAEGLNGAAVYLLRRPRYKAVAAYTSDGGRGLNHLVEVLRHRELPDGRLAHSMRDIARDFGNVCRIARDALQHALSARNVLALRAVLETTPCRESRVTLGAEKDALGVPRVAVDWRINDADRRGYERLMQTLRSEFSRLGLGRLVETQQYDRDGWPVSLTGGRHHMGTTRMSRDPRDGVVDAECRVHGIDNLYLAGSSVFPTGGYANPTLTIVALAIRLADRLRSALAPP